MWLPCLYCFFSLNKSLVYFLSENLFYRSPFHATNDRIMKFSYTYDSEIFEDISDKK